MATFAKDVLYPGTYWVSDGKGAKRKVVYSRQDVAALQQRMHEMLAAGLSIPLAAEHQEQAKPLTAGERNAEWVKKLTMGWAESAELAPEGFLTAKVAVPVDEDAKRIPASRFVSPEIVNNFVDGTGRLWPGPSITHLAVTPRPVNANQKPFQPVQMSHVVRLSLSDYEGEHMADESKDGKDEKKKEQKAEKDGDKKEEKKETPKPEENKLDLAGLRGLLEGDGYGVPDHITEPMEFLTHLHTAALSKKAMIDKLLQDEDDADDADEKPDLPASGGELPAGIAPDNGAVLMSLGGHTIQILRAAKSKKKEKIQMSHGNDPQAAAYALRLEKALLGREEKELKSRIAMLFQSGKITKPIHDKLVTDLGTVRLSLGDDGALASNSVMAKVEAYEALPPGRAWPHDGALPPDVRPAADQSGWEGHESTEQVNQTVNDFFGMLPGAKAASK